MSWSSRLKTSGTISHALIRWTFAGEELGHRRLPAGVDLRRRDPRLRLGQIVRLDVADQGPVPTKEQGVVPPTCLTQFREQLRPDRPVGLSILVEPGWIHMTEQAVAGHPATLGLPPEDLTD